jgi:hypothetical protein
MHFKTFLLHQKEEIEKYKWIESQKAGHDLGEAAVRQWVEKFAKEYRETYEDIFNELVKETADKCKNKLKEKLPGVSDELWNYVFAEVINNFTELWLKEMTCCCDQAKKKHIEEI